MPWLIWGIICESNERKAYSLKEKKKVEERDNIYNYSLKVMYSFVIIFAF